MQRRLLLLCLFPVLIWAQSYTATVRGTVTDSTQAAVPSTSIVLTEVDRNVRQTATSDGSGRYIFTAVPPGRYTIAAEAPGFRKYEVPAFQLSVQQQATINLELTVGDLATAVEVQATAPLLNTAAATLGQVVENRFIQTAPLAGRNPLALVVLTPGLVPTETSAGGTSSTNFVANGTRNSTAEVVMDGAAISGIEQNSGVTDVKYSPSVDVVEEFKVQTNYFSAEFGNTGGSIINIVSKSGTNEFHGVGYEFHRNAVLNANNFFSNSRGAQKPDYKRNVFGFTLGGPMVLPKIYDGRNRTFFFLDYEGSRQQSATTTTQTVPTDLQRIGDFSQTLRSNGSPYIIYNPYDLYTDADGNTLRRPFANNKIPDSMQNPISKGFLPYYPAATSEGNAITHVNNYYMTGVNKSRGDQMDIKVDHNISDKQRFTSRYSSKWGQSNPANLFGNIAAAINPGTDHGQNFVFDYTRSQNATTVMTMRASIMRVSSIRDPLSTGFDSVKELGVTPLFQSLGVLYFPRVTATSYMSLGPGGWAIIHRGEDVGLVNGSVTKIAGAHAIKAGAEFRVYHENYYQPGYPAGYFSFGRGRTIKDPQGSSSSQGNGIAGLLLGWGTGGEMDFDYPTSTASKYFGTYVQDDWRITSKLTLNLGFRYDFDIPRTERYNRQNWFDYAAPSPIAGQVPGFPNLKGVMMFATPDHRSPYNGDYNNFQPRFGLAYALGDKMSLRAGYGIYYSASRASIKGEIGSAFRSGTGINWSRDNNLTQYATMTNTFPDGLLAPPGRNPLAFLGHGFDAYDPYTVNPQWQQWNFSIQREVPGNGVVEVNYGGSKGTYLSFGTDDVLGNKNRLDPMYWGMGRDTLESYVNNPFYGVVTDPTSDYSLPTIQLHRLLRPYPQYTSAGGYTSPPYIGNSIYHSMQIKYEKRFSRGLSFLAHYTWSKLISDSDSPGTDVDWLGGYTGLQNWKNLRQERSLATFDVPQRAVVSVNYQLPIGRGRLIGNNMGKVADALVGGWEVSGILTFSAGYPIVPQLDSPDINWEGTQRPNVVGGVNACSANPTLDSYLNADAFTQPEPDTYGSAPRTLSNCRTFGIRNGDFTLMKNFKFTERKSLQIRVESFNLTNTPTFGRPGEAWGGDSFGQITGYASGRGPRELQLGVKFYY